MAFSRFLRIEATLQDRKHVRPIAPFRAIGLPPGLVFFGFDLSGAEIGGRASAEYLLHS
jgi:hypothetical protein